MILVDIFEYNIYEFFMQKKLINIHINIILNKMIYYQFINNFKVNQ